MKTVRFAQVVQRCGRPHVHALWVKPERDPEFSRARKADRVMTLEQSGRGKAEFGVVGFDPAHDRHAQFLVFPKSLQPFEGTRVVGVKFDLIDQPSAVSASELQAWQPRHRPRPAVASSVNDTTADAAETAASNGSQRKRATTKPPHHRGRRNATHASNFRPSNAPVAKEHGHQIGTASSSSKQVPSLVDEVRAALDEMRRGETVAAYERLRTAVEHAGHSRARKY